MSSHARVFVTGVEQSVAHLPEPPAYWSFSSLKDAEGCPRRFALSRARYPELWDGFGYPDRPSESALFGDVVHDALEHVCSALAQEGCTTSTSPEAVSVLRQLGGYSAVVARCIERRLLKLETNPRLDEAYRARLRDRLEARLPEARSEVQGFVQRLTLAVASRARERRSAAREEAEPRFARGPGSHVEATLRADQLRFTGRIDLLTVTTAGAAITDYKTGQVDETHAEQLTLYGLLWLRDEVSNAPGLPVHSLTVAYRGFESSVPIPDDAKLQQLGRDLESRIEVADELVLVDEPVAQPGDYCAFCSVRVLCSGYWQARSGSVLADNTPWFDFEGSVGEQNGARSWWIEDLSGANAFLLRTTQPREDFQTGQRIRLLNLRRDDDPEVTSPVATLTAMGEVFTCTAAIPN